MHAKTSRSTGGSPLLALLRHRWYWLFDRLLLPAPLLLLPSSQLLSEGYWFLMVLLPQPQHQLLPNSSLTPRQPRLGKVACCCASH